MISTIFSILLSCVLFLNTSALPIESKPLNNNPESWNLGWMVFTPRNASDPSAEALIGNDPHIKKSKITPKSIFIAPNSNMDKICPMGYRVDDNGKCIKTVTVNQDDILAARLADLFGGDDDDSNKATNSNSDYYDFFEEDKNENTGPLQFNIPLMIDVEESSDGTKKMEILIEEKVITMRNLPKLAPITEKSPVESTSETILEEVSSTIITESLKTTTETFEESTTEVTTTELSTTKSTTTAPSTTTTTTTTAAPIIFKNVDFMPKYTRKSNRTRVKNRPRKPKPSSTTTTTTVAPSLITASDLLSEQSQILPKRNRLKSGVKRRRMSTTTMALPTSSESPVTHKPFYWLPKGWTIDETKKDKPVLIRFWADQQQPQVDKKVERARSHNSRSQRMNSKMPTENIFKEVTVPELEELLNPSK